MRTLDDYLNFVFSQPFLKREEERVLFQILQDTSENNTRNKYATKRLTESHLRLVVSIAKRYCPRSQRADTLMDLISEGNIGLVKAIRKFDLTRGVRLSTYAPWWIKAEIGAYIARNISSVKYATGKNEKRIISNLPLLLIKYNVVSDKIIPRDVLEKIARDLNTSPEEIERVYIHKRGDLSLNVEVGQSGKGLSGQSSVVTYLDLLEDDTSNAEEAVIEEVSRKRMMENVEKFLQTIPPRNRFIFRARRLSEEETTLETLGNLFGISKERVRQIEGWVFKKLKKAMTESFPEELSC